MTENLLLLPPKEGGPFGLKVFTRPGVTGVDIIGRVVGLVTEAGDIASAKEGEVTVAGGERASCLAFSAAFICRGKRCSALRNTIDSKRGQADLVVAPILKHASLLVVGNEDLHYLAPNIGRQFLCISRIRDGLLLLSVHQSNMAKNTMR